MNINTLKKGFLRWIKHIQNNDHQLIIFNLHPYDNKLIPQFYEHHQVTSHNVTHEDGKELISQVHLVRNIHTLVQCYRIIIHLISHLLYNMKIK
jgi:hypothetical protein